MRETIIELKNISKSFGDVRVIEGIDFKIETGKVYALAGETARAKVRFAILSRDRWLRAEEVCVIRERSIKSFQLHRQNRSG